MAGEQQSTPFKTYHNEYMLESGKKLYLNEKTADVHFSFDSGDGSAVRVPAHKNLLAAVSKVFEAMFYGDLKEKGDITEVDVSDTVFKEFLQYFYLNEVKLTAENIVGVIHLGDKYDVKKCFDDGIQFLMDTLNRETVCLAFHVAKLYDHPELLKACETFMIVNTTEVFKSNDFLGCDKGVLKHIMKMDILSCSEVDVFEACLAWVKVKCGEEFLSKEMVDTHLGQLYDEIRFSSMTMHDVCALLTKYDSVLRSDFPNIMQTLWRSELRLDQVNSCQRYGKWNADAIVNCDRCLDDEKEAYTLSSEQKTVFSTNKSLLLGEFTCGKIIVGHFGPDRDLRWNLPVDVEITETTDLMGSNSKMLLKMKAELQSTDTIISLPNPVLIRPGFFYTIGIGRFPDEHCYYSGDMEIEVRLEPDVKIQFYHSNQELIFALNFNKI